MGIAFGKYQGLGNDFILISGSEAQDLGPEQARALCDRHFGIGADGVLITGVQDGTAFMRVINADGSTPEMCGNGLRCAALYLRHQGLVKGDTVTVETGAGPHACEISLVDAHEAQVSVDMPAASLDATKVLRDAQGTFLDGTLEAGDHSVRVTAVSTGNPHLVTFDLDEGLEATLGPALGDHARLRAGANVGFARMLGPGRMRLRVHERGAGWTLACGTGACAATVAAIETGRVPRGEPLEVELPGGALRILAGALEAPIEMRGPARRVFSGTLEGWPAGGKR